MKTTLRTKIAAGIMTMGLALAGGANAQVALPVGSIVFNDPAMQTSLGSFSVLATMSSPFVAADATAFSGVLDSWVLSGDTNNPLGGLDFVYRVTNAPTSADAIHRLAVNGFDGVQVQTGYINSGFTPSGETLADGLVPSLVDRGLAPGNNVGFSFLQGTVSGLTFNALDPGMSTRYLVMYTNATNYGESMASLIDGSVASADIFAPIPEPETYALLLAGLSLMGFVGRHRAKKNVA